MDTIDIKINDVERKLPKEGTIEYKISRITCCDCGYEGCDGEYENRMKCTLLQRLIFLFQDELKGV
jgi:hypothetical protein